MNNIKAKLNDIALKIKPLDEDIEQIDNDVDQMINSEMNKKINSSDNHLNKLNKNIADIEFKASNAVQLLAQYRKLIKAAKLNEALHDNQLEKWLDSLDDEA
jgi:hypothetical protein